jgi:hypothetical protein
MKNNSVYKSLLISIRQTVKESEGVPFNSALITTLASKIEPLAKFFTISTEEAIVLAFLVQSAIKDNDVNMNELITQFGTEISAIADIQQHILSLKEADLVYIKGNFGRRQRMAFKYVTVAPKALLAITEGDVSIMEIKPAEKFKDFLTDITELIIHRINEVIDTNKLISEIERVIKINFHLPEVKWISAQSDLKGIDMVMFLDIIIEHSTGEEEVYVEKIVKDIFDNLFEMTEYKQRIKNNQSPLLNSGLVVPAGEYFSLFSMVQLSDDAMNMVFGNMKDICKKSFIPRMGNIIDKDQIPEEKLSYNSRESEQIQTLTKALQQENYKGIKEKMVVSGMKPGFTVLMYGHPGTGKTSTVKSMAKKTGRHVYMVDIPKIQSKWVGESEKNLSRVFSEYRRAKKQYEQEPILLFNEADAILGKRIGANTSVDKMNNSMQNILLQELEDFEGIFVATTNLANHLDDAFDRRFLYKIEFMRPEEHVRYQIFEHAFPELDIDLISELNCRYSLTGGQIANLKKKILVKGMLESDFCLDEELVKLCEEELSLSKGSKRNMIGFVSQKQ